MLSVTNKRDVDVLGQLIFRMRSYVKINPFKSNEFFHPYDLDESILPFRGVRLILSKIF